jgi:cytochrome c-type biogenesis protein CcmH/NrfG
MSRLFDLLARLDRGRARPAGMGTISIPVPAAAGRRTWYIVGYLIILVGMAAIAMAVFVRPPAGTLTATVPTAPQLAALPMPEAPATLPAPAPPVSRNGSVLAQGLEAAQRGELAEAERLFRQAVAQDGGDAEAWNSLGVVLIRQGDREPGIEALRTALRLLPSHVEGHRNLGAVLDRLGRRDEASRHYRAFLSLTAEGHPGRDEVRRRLTELGRDPA